MGQLALDGAPWAGAGGARLSPSRRGYHSTWAEHSREHLAAYPICQSCGRPSQVSHHARPIAAGGPVLVPFGMLTALCHKCHTTVEASIAGGHVAYCTAGSAIHTADRWDWEAVGHHGEGFPWETT